MEKVDIERVVASAPAYYHNYIRKAGEGDLLESMESQIEEARDFFESNVITCVTLYAPGKMDAPTEVWAI